MSRRNLEYSILDQMAQLNTPVGASMLCSKIDAPQANIGRALFALEEQGFVEKVSNKGRVLTEAGRAHFQQMKQNAQFQEYVDVLLELYAKNDKKIYLDILEARILLETKSAEQAAIKATPEDIQEIEQILERHRMARALGKPAEHENLDFHYKLAEIAGNSVIYHLLKLILTQNSAYIQFSFMDYTLVGSTLFHARIFEAIKAHDPAQASKLMYDHLNALVKTLTDIEQSSLFSKPEDSLQ